MQRRVAILKIAKEKENNEDGNKNEDEKKKAFM